MAIWYKESTVRGAFTEVTAEDLAEHSWGFAGKLYPKGTKVLLHLLIPVVLEAELLLMKDPYSVWYEGV